MPASLLAALVVGLTTANWLASIACDPRPGHRLALLHWWIAGVAAVTALAFVAVRFRFGLLALLVAALGFYPPVTSAAIMVSMSVGGILAVHLYTSSDWRRPFRPALALVLVGWMLIPALLLALASQRAFKQTYWLVPTPMYLGMAVLGWSGLRRRAQDATRDVARRFLDHPAIAVLIGILCFLLVSALNVAVVMQNYDDHRLLRPTIDY